MAEQKKPNPGTIFTHKVRASWYHGRSSFPLREAPPTELENAWANLEPFRANPEHYWEEAGPHKIAGRVTCLIVHADQPDTLYAGSAGGGIWRSTDAGLTWESKWPLGASHNIGAMAVHPLDRSSLIVATGEANLSADGYPGSGFYVSRDAGDSWKPFFSTPDGKPIPEEFRESIPRRVGTIAFSPSLNDQIYAAVGSVSLDERMQAGLYLFDKDHGLVPCTFWGQRSYNCHAVVYHPKVPGLLFAAVEPRGTQNGIWRSEDRGATWLKLQHGLPEGQKFRRTSLALAPSDPDTIYALAADRCRNLLGIFRSNDRGHSWRQIANGSQFPDENFMSYNNAIVVHPTNPDFVIWGGVNLHRTTNAGRTWKQISFRFPGSPHHVHEDHHALVMPNGDMVFSGNDGGVAYSHDGGDTWAPRSQGMVTTMFYDVDMAPTNCHIFGGGAQDNGTLVAGVSSAGGEFVRAFSGDGGWLVFDPDDAEHVFGSAQNLTVRRHRPGEPWIGWTDVSPKPEDLTFEERSQRSIAVLAIDPVRRKGVRRLWAGSNRLWCTADDGETWEPASDPFDGSAISAIEISWVNPHLMFVGTSVGGLYRSTDGGKTWCAELGSIDIPPHLITRIVTHPRFVDTVVVAVASTGLPGTSLLPAGGAGRNSTPLVPHPETPFRRPYSNIFLSDDAGGTWKDIDQGWLPNVVFNAVEYETLEPYRLFAGGDAGVFVRVGDGWLPMPGNMPNVVVSDLVYHEKDQMLTAATYGRGIWRLRTDRLSAGR